MGTIKLQNIRTFSYHGCLVEESKIGSQLTIYGNPKNVRETKGSDAEITLVK